MPGHTRLLAVLMLAGSCQAADLLPKPTTAGHEYTLQVTVCKRLESGKCVQTATSQLAAMAGDKATTANYRQITFLGPSDAQRSKVGAQTVDFGKLGAKEDRTSQPLELQAVKVGYEFTLKPLYETDGLTYIQYDLNASQIVRWMPSTDSKPTATPYHLPDLQGVTITGTGKARVGESFKVERSGYEFEVRLIAVDVSQAG